MIFGSIFRVGFYTEGVGLWYKLMHRSWWHKTAVLAWV